MFFIKDIIFLLKDVYLFILSSGRIYLFIKRIRFFLLDELKKNAKHYYHNKDLC
ncbi:hypothetical protein CLV55_101196 [Flavobacterium aciduliphilum]|uniref:Uncharacterized protein n=1 Tax=Flavobacterium aciduliphilum TaxID=1101402 RepID=A0A328YZJ9_9FLAO|nr:hypothetical protein CLV55_101196 [Flavobacterium aciduliphilum]